MNEVMCFSGTADITQLLELFNSK
uniref:Uncharacterized protein n=1 Tax=Anguilla anguilla TaxID=7936 RepID=A0A0E9UYC9_ANGAN